MKSEDGSMDIRDMVREDIKNLVPYEPHLYSNVIKLDANENPHSFPEIVIREIFGRLNGEVFTRYPDPGGQQLKGRISDLIKTEPDNIVLGNGSDELIQLIMQTFGGPGKRVVIPVPTFSMYKIHGQITGTLPVEVQRNEDFSLNTELLLTEMNDPDTRVTFIATPNNPTGNSVPLSQIEKLVRETGSLVVVDEAYIDFGGETALPLLNQYPNMIILRTLSKVALAGLRVGYLAAHKDVTRELLKVKQPYNVNAFSQLAAAVVLDNWSTFRQQIGEITAERERLQEELAKIPGILNYPSDANFILFRVPGSPGKLHQELVEQGLLVRNSPGSTHGLDKCLRVTVGTRQENDLFLEKLRNRLIP
ncbi:MAG TPA: histidinol-phosphate transaminase [Verrucomicrobiae bacterium]|nr:histidinol-phosphate transaminase [Verrucomicrobiae bacterium]